MTTQDGSVEFRGGSWSFVIHRGMRCITTPSSISRMEHLSGDTSYVFIASRHGAGAFIFPTTTATQFDPEQAHCLSSPVAVIIAGVI